MERYFNDGADKACEVLIETAAQRWREYEGDYRDDITAVVVKLQDLWKGVDDDEIDDVTAKMWDEIDVEG